MVYGQIDGGEDVSCICFYLSNNALCLHPSIPKAEIMPIRLVCLDKPEVRQAKIIRDEHDQFSIVLDSRRPSE
jgi:hypothetical protein